MKLTIGTILLSFSTTNAFSAAGTNSATFLLQNLSARQVGMGGIYASIADDSNSMFGNPSGLSYLKYPELNLSYLKGNDQSKHATGAFAFPLIKTKYLGLGIGVGYSYYSAGNIDLNFTNAPSRSVNAETSMLGLASAGLRIGRFIAAGITPKYLRSELVDQFEGTAYVVDAGVLFYPIPGRFNDKLVVGAVVQNYGENKIQFNTAEENLPQTKAVGISAWFWDSDDFGAFLGSAQGEETLGEKRRYRFGGEFSFGRKTNRAFFLRGGYRMQFENQTYSVGVGIRERNIQIDYSFVNADALDRTHQVNLIFKFGDNKPLPIDDERF